MVRVYFEVGKVWVFACAVDYPGWQHRAKGEEAALETLEDTGAGTATRLVMRPSASCTLRPACPEP